MNSVISNSEAGIGASFLETQNEIRKEPVPWGVPALSMFNLFLICFFGVFNIEIYTFPVDKFLIYNSHMFCSLMKNHLL